MSVTTAPPSPVPSVETVIPETVTTVRPRTSRRRRVAIIGLVLASFLGGIAYDRATVMGVTDPNEFALIAESWELLLSEYVDAEHLDRRVLANGAISGMADAVGDTDHTSFLTPEEAAELADIMAGSYVGIGIELDHTADVPTIAYLVAGAPAMTAGLKVGDQILAIDGRPTGGDGKAQALDSLGGTTGRDVVLRVRRSGRATPLDIRVTRAEIDVPLVSWAMVPGTKIALVRLLAFGDGSADDVRDAVDDAIVAEASGLVVDLRGNPGGTYEEAIKLASIFLPQGTVVVRERDADGVQTVRATVDPPAAEDITLVVLVDGDSGSSSEIVTGALQDGGRASIVGTRTAGTGTLIQTWTLTDGSELSIGTSLWLTPLGRSAWHVGLEPDFVVSLPPGASAVGPDELAKLGPAGLAKSRDNQLIVAVGKLESD